METIKIKSITNTLPKHNVVIKDDKGVEFTLAPGKSIFPNGSLSLPVLPNVVPAVEENVIRYFKTVLGNRVDEYTFICKNGKGIISALGNQTEDFQAPSSFHTSIPSVSPGDTVSLTFNIDAENVTWVIGEIDNI